MTTYTDRKHYGFPFSLALCDFYQAVSSFGLLNKQNENKRKSDYLPEDKKLNSSKCERIKRKKFYRMNQIMFTII